MTPPQINCSCGAGTGQVPPFRRGLRFGSDSHPAGGLAWNRGEAVFIAACVVVVFLHPGTSRAADAGLVAWWAFDEGAGEILRDRSGHGNHGRISGCRWIKNGEGHALEFDGVDDHVDCGEGS